MENKHSGLTPRTRLQARKSTKRRALFISFHGRGAHLRSERVHFRLRIPPCAPSSSPSVARHQALPAYSGPTPPPGATSPYLLGLIPVEGAAAGDGSRGEELARPPNKCRIESRCNRSRSRKVKHAARLVFGLVFTSACC